MGSAYTSAFVTAKVTDLALVTFYYFSLALVFSVALNYITQVYETYLPSKEKTTRRLALEITANIFFVAVAFWVIRNVVERIPFPLEGMGGYRHARLSQSTTAAIATLTLVLFQTSLTDKIRELNARIFKKGGDAMGGGAASGFLDTLQSLVGITAVGSGPAA